VKAEDNKVVNHSQSELLGPDAIYSSDLESEEEEGSKTENEEVKVAESDFFQSSTSSEVDECSFDSG